VTICGDDAVVGVAHQQQTYILPIGSRTGIIYKKKVASSVEQSTFGATFLKHD